MCPPKDSPLLCGLCIVCHAVKASNRPAGISDIPDDIKLLPSLSCSLLSPAVSGCLLLKQPYPRFGCMFCINKQISK